MTVKTAAVRASRLTKIYEDGQRRLTVLDNLDIDFQRGEFTAIMGPAGSGKSTLMHCLAGLEKPTGGRVWLGETRISGLDERSLRELRRHRIGFIFQSYNLLPVLTVAENIMLALELAGREVDRDFADLVVNATGLRDRLLHLPSRLPEGLRRCVSAARTLMLKPDVILADDPTRVMDLRAAEDMVRLLRRAVDELGQTVVMVTHDPAAAAKADRVVFFENGRVATELRRPTLDEVHERMGALERRRRGVLAAVA